MSHRKAVEAVFVVSIALGIGSLFLWKVLEYDLSWQLKLGRELLAFRGISLDRWSYTIPGQPWYPLHWLSYLLFALIAKLGGYEALCLLRSVLVAIWIAGLGLIVRRISPPGPVRLMSLVLWPIWILLCCHWQVILRPDFISVCFFTYLILISMADYPHRRKLILSLLLLLIWAGFHSGTFPMGWLYFAGWVLSDRTEAKSRRALWAAAALCCWFATPNGFGVVDAVFQLTANYGERLQAMGNPDMEPFTRFSLSFRYRGWAYQLWVAYTVLATGCLGWSLFRRSASAPPGPYRDAVFPLVLGVAFTALTVSRIRAITYQVTFLLPIVASYGAQVFEVAWRREGKARVAAFSLWAITMALALGQMVPDDLFRLLRRDWGLGIDSKSLPVRALAFLNKAAPKGRLLNHIDWGGLLMDQAPSYPVAMDGRDIPFLPFMKELKRSSYDLREYARFLKKYEINSVLDQIQGGLTGSLYPTAEWAQVFFDNVSILYVRRMPEHTQLIRTFEYKQLRRPIPFDELLKISKPEARGELNAEVHRCLEDDPENAYCRYAEARVLERDGNLEGALSDLQIARKSEPWSTQVLVAQAKLFDRLGRPAESRAVRRWMKRLGVLF